MIIKPREYQRAAVRATWDFAKEHGGRKNPAIVLPTGTGKSVVVAMLCADVSRRWKDRVLVLVPRKELVLQNSKKIEKLCGTESVGALCDGLSRYEVDRCITVATPGTTRNRIDQIARPSVVIVDEAHLIPPDGDGVLYRQILDRFLDAFAIGLTATPFRMSSGSIVGPDRLFDAIAYEAPLEKMVDDGWLAPIVAYEPKTGASDYATARLQSGDFRAKDIAVIAESALVVNAAVREIVEATRGRRSVLVFASSVGHASMVRDALEERLDGERVEVVLGVTPPAQRAEIIERFRLGDLRYLVNVDVLTTGFDAPNVDAIAMLRPTMSPGLLVQMVGRGARVAPAKENCILLDFSGNLLRHGPIDRIRGDRSVQKSPAPGAAPTKTCPECRRIVPAGSLKCEACGYEWGAMVARHRGAVTGGAALSRDATRVPRKWYTVDSVTYRCHRKGNPKPGKPPRTLRVTYGCGLITVNRFICVEHTGYARYRAEEWWRRRTTEPLPATVEEAVRLTRDQALRSPKRILATIPLGKNEYPEIYDEEFPEDKPSSETLYGRTDELPF